MKQGDQTWLKINGSHDEKVCDFKSMKSVGRWEGRNKEEKHGKAELEI